MDGDVAQLRGRAIRAIARLTSMTASEVTTLSGIIDTLIAGVQQASAPAEGPEFTKLSPSQRQQALISDEELEQVLQRLQGQDGEEEFTPHQRLALAIVAAAAEHAGKEVAELLETRSRAPATSHARRLGLWLLVHEFDLLVSHACVLVGLSIGPANTGFHVINDALDSEELQAELSSVLAKAKAGASG